MQLNEIWSIIEERNKVNIYDDSNMKLLYHGEPAYIPVIYGDYYITSIYAEDTNELGVEVNTDV